MKELAQFIFGLAVVLLIVDDLRVGGIFPDQFYCVVHAGHRFDEDLGAKMLGLDKSVPAQAAGVCVHDSVLSGWLNRPGKVGGWGVLH